MLVLSFQGTQQQRQSASETVHGLLDKLGNVTLIPESGKVETGAFIYWHCVVDFMHNLAC